MATPTSTGMNRTGLQMAPLLAGKMMELSQERPSQPGEALPLAEARERIYRHSEPVGSVPPPGTMKGMARTALEMLKGHKPTVFIDKLGERLAFERTGVRLYEAVLIKHDALGSWDGGPSSAELRHIRDEELEHFMLLKDAMERLGADPTAMTPSADITAVETSGVLKVVTDPRTTLPQALHAMLIAEAADMEGWSLLIGLADSIGQDELASRFRTAQFTEDRHQQWVRSWLNREALADAERQIGPGQGSG